MGGINPIKQIQSGPLNVTIPRIVQLFQRRPLRTSRQRRSLQFRGTFHVLNEGSACVAVKVVSCDNENLQVVPEYAVMNPSERLLFKIRILDRNFFETVSKSFCLLVLTTACQVSFNSFPKIELQSYWNKVLKKNNSFVEAVSIKRFQFVDFYGITQQFELGKGDSDYIEDFLLTDPELTPGKGLFDAGLVYPLKTRNLNYVDYCIGDVDEATLSLGLKKWSITTGAVLALLIFTMVLSKLNQLEAEIVIWAGKAKNTSIY